MDKFIEWLKSDILLQKLPISMKIDGYFLYVLMAGTFLIDLIVDKENYIIQVAVHSLFLGALAIMLIHFFVLKIIFRIHWFKWKK